jgi:hypothetical protein
LRKKTEEGGAQTKANGRQPEADIDRSGGGGCDAAARKASSLLRTSGMAFIDLKVTARCG